MKTRTLRTAGTAALGIAFAAAAAGPAAAAGVGGAANTVSGLPLATAAKNLPGGVQSAEATRAALGTGLGMIPLATAAALPALDTAPLQGAPLGGPVGSDLPTSNLNGLSVPTGPLAQNLPQGLLGNLGSLGGLLGG